MAINEIVRCKRENRMEKNKYIRWIIFWSDYSAGFGSWRKQCDMAASFKG